MMKKRDFHEDSTILRLGFENQERTGAYMTAGDTFPWILIAPPQQKGRFVRYSYHFQTHRCDSYRDCSIKMQIA